MKLHTKIFIGLLAGGLSGLAVNVWAGGAAWVGWVNTNVAGPVGQVFLRILFMTVVPLVFTSIALGVTQLGDIRKVGRVGVRSLGYFLLSTVISAAIGILLVNLVRPGVGVPVEVRQQLLDAYRGQVAGLPAGATTRFGVDFFVNIVPRNPIQAAANLDMLGIIFFALVFGAALTLLPEGKARPLVQVLVRFLGGLRPSIFWRRITPSIVTAFTTSSSNATLPTNIAVAEDELKIPPKIAGFVLSLGSTMCHNGTALYEGVTVLFLAQLFGVDLTLGQQVIAMIMSVITAVGTAGVPGGSLAPLMVVCVTVGVPPEVVGVVYGVERILDMSRTTLNVCGDLTAAVYVARTETDWDPRALTGDVGLAPAA